MERCRMCQNMSGLSTAEVEFRKKAGLSNESVDSSTKTVAQIIRSNVVTYYNLIFLIITILLIVVGSFRDLTFLPIIIANMLIGIIQELRSKKILDDLTILNTPKITVRRNGSDQEVLADELVQDDVITLSAGGQIPADALVLSGNITVNEALITGEADEIVKKEGDSIFSGSFVISGECLAKLEKVGKDSYISGLMLQATQTKEGEQSEMIRALNRLVQTVGVIILPIGAILFLQQYFFSGATMKDSVTGMVAAILGMIPEGLCLLASVAMVVSVMRLGKQKVLIHDMKCIETLARVNVLCVDKTGTITVPEMEVAQFILAKDQNLAAEEEKNKVAKTISDCVRALPCDNATMEALQQYFTEPMENSAEKIVPFSSATKYSGVVLAGKAYVVGAPEFVLRQDYAAVQGTIEVFLEKGYRVLVFAEYEGNLDGKELTENATPIAFILLNNAIREGAMDTFRYFSKRGVEVKVISGDNPVTVSEIAKKAGIRHAEKQVDAATLKTAEAVRKAAKKYTVFGRVTPEQKRLLVQALKEQGKTVAMTGDGVNDAPALKQADIGVAMGITGTEVAKDAAAMVLTDDNFATIVKAVENGRNLYRNIQYAIQFLLSGNFGAILAVLYASVTGLPVPFAPVHLLFINLLTDSLPAIALGMEPSDSDVMNDKPRAADESILTKDFLGKIGLEGFVIGAMTMIAFLTGYHQDGALLGSTYAFGTLCLARLFHGFNCKSDHPVIFTKRFFNNPWLQGAFVLGAVLITAVLTVPGLHRIFQVETLNPGQLGCVYLYAFASLLIIQLLKWIRTKLGKSGER